MARTNDFAGVVAALRDSPEFLAGWIAPVPGGEPWLAESLGLDRKGLQRLLLCRAPRPSTFTADVGAISTLVGVQPSALAAALREAVALTTLSAASVATREEEAATHLPGLLTAARDTTQEAVGRRTTKGSYIRRLADQVRARAPRDAAAILDVQSFVAWAAPLAVVALPELRITVAHGWLAERGVALGFGNKDRPLRGLLLAWRGSGLIFVDGSIPMADRRFTVAHELGHFLLDYMEPRGQVLRRDPDLLEVIDGHRLSTTEDRARAVLDGLPLGVHTHLLDRDPHGHGTWEMERGEDLSSRFALELLSPWNSARAIVGQVPNNLTWEARLEEATRLIESRFQLPSDVARTRARTILESAGMGTGFFDR